MAFKMRVFLCQCQQLFSLKNPKNETVHAIVAKVGEAFPLRHSIMNRIEKYAYM